MKLIDYEPYIQMISHEFKYDMEKASKIIALHNFILHEFNGPDCYKYWKCNGCSLLARTYINNDDSCNFNSKIILSLDPVKILTCKEALMKSILE